MTRLRGVLVRSGVVGSMVLASLGWGLPHAGASGVSLSQWVGPTSAVWSAFETTYTSLMVALKHGETAKARTLFEKAGMVAVNLATDADSSSTVLNNAVVVLSYDMEQWAWDGYVAIGGSAVQVATYVTMTSHLTAAATAFTKDLKKVK